MNQIFSSIINPIKFAWKTLLENEGFGDININNDSEINMGKTP